MGATSNVRNPQPYSLATGTTEYSLFRRDLRISSVVTVDIYIFSYIKSLIIDSLCNALVHIMYLTKG